MMNQTINMKEKKYLSMTGLLKSKRLSWIKSLPTLKKWVMRDIKRRNILRTIVIKNEGRGVRYYFTPQYIEDYVNAFYRGELDLGKRYDNSKKNS